MGTSTLKAPSASPVSVRPGTAASAGLEGFRLQRASGAGHCVGHGSLESGGVRVATAVTTEATEAVVVSRRLLEAETRVFTRGLLERKMRTLQATRPFDSRKAAAPRRLPPRPALAPSASEAACGEL